MHDHAEFLRLFLRHEAELRAFIGSVIRDAHAREDVLQETAVILWREFPRYDRARSFGAWARGIAARKLLEQRNTDRRAPVPFSPEAVKMLAAAAERAESRDRPSLEALEHCVDRLPDRSRRLLAMRYGAEEPPERIAVQIKTTTAAVYQALWRLRTWLRKCMERYLAFEREDNAMDRRTEELIQKHLDCRASEAELAELDRLLVQSPAAADALWKAAEVDAILAMLWQSRRWRAAGCGERGAGGGEPGLSNSRSPIHNPPSPARRRRAIAGLAAAALVLIALTAWWHGEAARGHRVMSGTVEVAGVPVTRIAENDALRVVGNQMAVIRLAGGSEAELTPATSAVVRGPSGSALQVIELLEGGGRFRVPRASRRLCVETAGGSVTAADTDFQVNLWSTQGKGDDEMRFRSLFVLAVAVSTGMVEVNSPDEECVLPAGARAVFGAEAPTGGKVKDLGSWLPPGDALGFKQKDRPFALEQLLPGVTGAVRVTDEQKKQLATAIDETINRREVRAAIATAKLNPNATEAQKQEARKLIEQARAELKSRVATILTPEQKTLIDKINAAVAEAHRQTSEAMQDDLLAVKSDPSRKDKVQKEFQQRVRSAMESGVLALLDADAKAAFQAAAQAASAKPPKKGQEPNSAKPPKNGPKPKK